MNSFFLVQLLVVMLGGAVGGTARHALTLAIEGRLGSGFPWGTVTVNVSGAAAIGVLAALLPVPTMLGAADGLLWPLLVVGVLGSYTTVSSFSLQTLVLARTGQPLAALANVAASTGLCLAAAFAGHALAGGAV
jgi:fluoride exporter